MSLLKKERMENVEQEKINYFYELRGRMHSKNTFAVLSKINVKLFGIFNRIKENMNFIKQREL